MVLDENGMQRARELAREMVRIQKETMTNISGIFESIKKVTIEVFREIRDSVMNVWAHIQAIYEKEEEIECHDFNWYVPMNVRIPEAPYIKKSRMFNIRNGI